MRKTFPKRAIHLDFHTMPGVYDVGSKFNADEFARTLKKSEVDYITVFARCNRGFAYYPTRIGIPHPGMKKGMDMLGGMISECHRHGIRVAAYFNAGIDHEHALLHRDWCKVNREGKVCNITPSGISRWMCMNTPYAGHLLSMVGEVLDKYPVDGIFLDCFTFTPCYGAECVDGMKQLGMDVFDEEQCWQYCGIVNAKFMEEAKALVKKKNKDAYLHFNGFPYYKQPTHVEIEVLPTGSWGYDSLPWIIRYVRTLGKPFFTMTGRFHKSWGDFGGIRSRNSLLFDLYNSVANGGTCSVGDHLHPRGKLEPAVYSLIGQAYSDIRKLEPWTADCKTLTEIVVVDPEIVRVPSFSFDLESVAGAARMLMELKCQFDVSDGRGDLSRYKVVILPDRINPDGELKKKLKAHIRSGGAVISSGSSLIDEEKEEFVLEEYKISYHGREKYSPSFFMAEKEVSDGLPDMPVAIYDSGVRVRGEKSSRVLARLYRPYFNSGSWDWRHENHYTPPEKDTGRPALVQCGNIFHFAFPVFSSYYKHAVTAYKHLVGNCINKGLPSPLVKTANMPSFAQVTLTRQDKRTAVHILAYMPELRGNRAQVIEEPLLLKDVRIGVRADAVQSARRVILAPSCKRFSSKTGQGYLWITVPEVKGYAMIVIE